jgi:hypothetical protein
MNFAFDKFNQYEIPSYILCNPDKSQLYAMGDLFDRQLKLRFNSLSEITFTAKSKITSNNVEIDTPYFELLDYRRLVYIEDIGYFMITQIDQDNDGVIETKKITAKSLEVELGFKKLSLFKFDSHPFYNEIRGLSDPSTLLGTLLQYAPGWTVAHVDSELWSLYRSFDITDQSIYNFLMNDVSQTYQAIFTFDTINKAISVYTAANATTTTDIVLSYDNLVEKTNIKEITEELCTALAVFGGGDLNIRTVNPLGTNTIYNFNYYKTSDWMDSPLIAALNAWELKVNNLQPVYADILTSLKIEDVTLLGLESNLTLLQDQLTSLENIQKTRIQGKITGEYIDESVDPPITWPSINDAVKAKQVEIDAKQVEIDAENLVIKNINDDLIEKNYTVSFENPINFTSGQLFQLNTFIIGSTYTDANFIKTDIMSASAIQDMAQELYNQAKGYDTSIQGAPHHIDGVLDKVSEPRYTFDVTSVNFVFLKDFQTFIDQLELGCTLTIQFDENRTVVPALLGIDFSYDNPVDFKLTFSNRLRLDDAEFQFSDLFNGTINSGISTNFNSELWSNWTNNYKDDVSEFLKSALNASRNMVINASDQSFIIDSNGLRARYLDPATNQFDPRQIWMINNMLAFTRDNFDNVNMAIGEINTYSGSVVTGSAYGIVGDIVNLKKLEYKKLEWEAA